MKPDTDNIKKAAEAIATLTAMPAEFNHLQASDAGLSANDLKMLTAFDLIEDLGLHKTGEVGTMLGETLTDYEIRYRVTEQGLSLPDPA